MIRKAEYEDLNEITAIYDKARSFMRQNGNMRQWSNGYPSRELLSYDIEQGTLYVLLDDFGLYGVFMLRVGDDPTYRVIREGAWMDSSPYAVLHRLASSGRRKGVLHEALCYASLFTDHIRVDTHESNRPMQNALLKEGFSRRGIIVCDDGTDRVAFERIST